MRIRARLASWLRAIFLRSQGEREMTAEIQLHIEARAEDLMRGGAAREEALRQHLVHHDHRRAPHAIRGQETPALQQRDAHGLEVVGGGDEKDRLRRLALLGRRTARDPEAREASPARDVGCRFYV